MCRHSPQNVLSQWVFSYAVRQYRHTALTLENPEKKASIREMFQAIACEMEGGSIGHVCFVNNVPFAILRSISDGDGGAIDYQTFAEKAAVQSIDVVIEYLNRI